MPARRLNIGLSLSATWLRGACWRRADSRAEDIYGVELPVSLARRAEAAKLDFVFLPDVLHLDSDRLGEGPGFGAVDPTLLLTAIAAQTRRIGLVSTLSTSFVPPYLIARQIQSLNLLSGGRAGWNVVTSLDGAANFGAAPLPDPETRYRRAAEAVAVVRRLWRSYPAAALRLDRAGGVYADAAQVRAIDHSGDFFDVAGPLNTPGCAAGDPALFQAGASETGRDFAASVADAIFAATPDMAAGQALRADLWRRAAAKGRQETAPKVLPGLSFFLAPSRAQAQELYADAHRGLDDAALRAAALRVVGLDLGDLPPDARIDVDMLPPSSAPVRSRTHADLLRAYILRARPTVAQLLERPELRESAHWTVVGTPEDAAAEIARWTAHAALDGVVALPGGSLESLRLFLDEVTPMLTERGLFRRAYAGATLRAHLTEP